MLSILCHFHGLLSLVNADKLMSRTRFDKPHLALDAYRRSSLVIGCIGDLLSIRESLPGARCPFPNGQLSTGSQALFLAVLQMGCLLLLL
jgi:hypothetical protein